MIPPLFNHPQRAWAVLETPDGYAIGPWSALFIQDLPYLVHTADTRADAVAWVESSLALEDM